jgi:hypothetical protein
MNRIDRWISQDFSDVCCPSNIESASDLFGRPGFTPNYGGDFNTLDAA